MSCINSSIVPDSYYSNLNVSGILNACETNIERNLLNQTEVITLVEIESPTAVYNITPKTARTIITFTDVLRYNTDLRFDIDNTFANLNDQIVFNFSFLILDESGEPVEARINTPYPMYYFSYDWSNPQSTTDYLLVTTGTNYYLSDPAVYTPSRIRFPFYYNGEVWINTQNISP